MLFSNSKQADDSWSERLKKNSLIMILAFAVMGWFSAADLKLMMSSNSWNSVPATVIESQINRGFRGGPDSPHIAFAYTVNGQTYISEQIDFGQWNYDVAHYLQKYPIGKTVSAFYDPIAPQRAVLEKSGSVAANLLLVLLMWGSAACLVHYRFKN
ncbi:DUF3592 domain-containing protein [Glaciecola sp. SC05]|uniref:DUF3592 domain-containing protein n=1 Tax=Glaciecola sp. SC05 TaxID=1987355 RepID=UPI003528E65F